MGGAIAGDACAGANSPGGAPGGAPGGGPGGGPGGAPAGRQEDTTGGAVSIERKPGNERLSADAGCSRVRGSVLAMIGGGSLVSPGV